MEILTFVLSICGSGFVGMVVSAYINKKKNAAEIRKINTEADMNVGTSWQEYAMQMRRDMETLRKEFNALNVQMGELRGQLKQKDEYIKTLTQILQGRNPELIETLKEIRGFMEKIYETTLMTKQNSERNTKILQHQEPNI